MVAQQPQVRIRIDVDYPYASRPRSFLAVALRRKHLWGEPYLRNARIIAAMINDSPKNVLAYWFFTPYTVPDQQLLALLKPERHEVALHVATNPVEEWKNLEKQTGRTVQSYTIHGTRRIFTRLLWGRKLSQSQAPIPKDFPLKNFHDLRTYSLDAVRYSEGFESSLREATEWIHREFVVEIHPEWLFRAGGKRGPFYDVLKAVLDVDEGYENIHIHRRFFARVARCIREYENDLKVTPQLEDKLRANGADVLTFLDRKWCCPIQNPQANWIREDDNIGLLEIEDYDKWWSDIGKKTRNMVRKAEKSGVIVAVAKPNEELAIGIHKIYDETPIRQERAFPHYGEPLETVRSNMYAAKNNAFINATLDGEIVGFIQLLFGDRIAIISNILTMQKHWDKSLNNALLAKAVEVTAAKGERWLMYGRIGNHPSLDKFKENNGFQKCPISRFYVPLTGKGKAAIRLHMHRELKDTLPDAIKYPLIPALNWVSRTKVKLQRR